MNGWKKFIKESFKLAEIVNTGDAMAVYSSELRGRASGEDSWQKEIVVVPKGAVSEPGMSEIGYPSFLAALIKLTIVG